jgi:hypothetical protein
MISAGKTGLGNNPPIIGAQINFDKGYAFLEFEHSKVATDCMLFDGIILEGNTLKMRRPKDYVALPESYREVCLILVCVLFCRLKKKKTGRGFEYSSEAKGHCEHCGSGAGRTVLDDGARHAQQALLRRHPDSSDGRTSERVVLQLRGSARIQHGA